MSNNVAVYCCSNKQKTYTYFTLTFTPLLVITK